MKVTIKDKNRLPEIITNCKKISGKKIWVGIEPGKMSSDGELTLQALASIHEYGCRINVTPKMRAYLHRQGLHLKETTTTIVIPERSFIRAGYDQNEKSFLKFVESQLENALFKGHSIDTFLSVCADQLAGDIQEFAVDLSSPKNHPFTVEQKGSSNPLVDTGEMIRAIKGKVVE